MSLESNAVLTPYVIPRALQGGKIRNMGDGFILRAIERLLGHPFAAELVFSPRVTPSAMAKERMKYSHLVVLAGANQLNDHYAIWPGLTSDEIQQTGWRFVPFGLGLHGEPGRNDGMSQATARILEQVHERITYSSWRCPLTLEYLQRSLPHLASRFLMTGCPVVYDAPLLHAERFQGGESRVAVTATERQQFWQRETDLIDAVARRFPCAQKYFVVHQNFSPPAWHETLRHRLLRPRPEDFIDKVRGLRAYARMRGFSVVIPGDTDDCVRFYEDMDLHVGTRLHAHLLFLSRNKRSFLVPVDQRSLGIAQDLGFPLVAPSELGRHWDFDFERIRNRARSGYQVMQRFTQSLAE